MYRLIASYGLSLLEAMELKAQGKLPCDLAAAWDEEDFLDFNDED